MSETKDQETWADVKAALDTIAGAKNEAVETPAPGLKGDVDTGSEESEELSEDEPEEKRKEHVVMGRDPAIMEQMGPTKPEVRVAPNPFVAPEGSQGRLIRKGISEREVELIGNLVYDRICQEIGIKRGAKLQTLIDANLDKIGTTMAREDEGLGKRIGAAERRLKMVETGVTAAAETRAIVDRIGGTAMSQIEARVLSCETKVSELASQLADNLSTIKEATEQMTAALVKYAPMRADDEDETKSLPSTVTKAKHVLEDIGSRLETITPLAAAPTVPIKKPKVFNY